MNGRTAQSGHWSTVPRQQPDRRGDGFTLVEVLVVIAIIALLVAILVPSLMKVRENTRRVICQSNLRHIMNGWQLYLKDSKDHFPRGALLHINYGGKLGTLEQNLREAEELEGNPPPPPRRPLNKYLELPPVPSGPNAADVFRCPSDRDQLIQWYGEDGDIKSVNARYYDHYGNSYRGNRYLIGPEPPDVSEADPCYEAISDALVQLDYDAESNTVAQFEFTNTSRLLVVGDFGWDASWYGGGAPFDVPEWHGRKNTNPNSYWHNIGFMDGHVSFTEIVRGVHVRGDYTVIPFRSLQSAFTDCQIPGNF